MRSGAAVGTPSEALRSGAICAVAGQSQRDMQEWARAYPALFSARPFDGALFSTLALASAFSGPWLGRDELRMANRVTLWCFGLDWLVDYVAKSQAEVAGITRRCLAVADGGPAVPGDDLTRFLADIRDELAASGAFPALGPVWRDELARTLDGMAQEWTWKAARAADPAAGPTFDDYLANADNLGFSFVFASHWIFTSPPPPGDVDGVRAASWAVQRVVRLLNDVATYERDVSWGDLNALMLGATRDEVGGHIVLLADRARRLIEPLRGVQPRLADYLERQMEFCVGFYGVADYWGRL